MGINSLVLQLSTPLIKGNKNPSLCNSALILVILNSLRWSSVKTSLVLWGGNLV